MRFRPEQMPAVIRSRFVLAMAYELVANPKWLSKQAKVSLRPPGTNLPWNAVLFGSEFPSVIDEVARGEVQVAIVNPAQALGVAARGAGPFTEPVPVRIIAVIPSLDQLAFAIHQRIEIGSLEDIRDRRLPLRFAMRDNTEHATHMITHLVLSALGFSLDDILKWGGERRTYGFPPDVIQVARGEADAIFDEAVDVWMPRALAIGMRPLALAESLLQRLEDLGLRRALIARSEYPQLESDIPTVDFSGWAVFTHRDVADDVVYACCGALEAARDRLPWQGEGPVPLERMCRDAPDTPLVVPLHPAAEQYWGERGFL